MPVGFDGLGTEGPQLMAPMDLYESIWGGMSWPPAPLPFDMNTDVRPLAESPDPWNPGTEPMNFDFLAQPPPGQSQHQLYF